MRFSINGYSPDIHKTAFVAPNATLIGRVTIGSGSSIWFGTVIRADINEINIGANTNIQDGCLLHVTHEQAVFIGECVTVGHGAILHGCRVESSCLISMGAIVLDGAQVGGGSIVAAGAVVTPGTLVPPKSLVMGVPAKVIRPVTSEDLSRIEAGWQHYLAYADTYRQSLGKDL
jgi:carbonic anhydrase/acetyltransferase-like protein (isoleucine patch superfamily)